MSFTWTAHRFSGGALALDVANSVILRHDAARRLDRFAQHDQRLAFPAAARALCAERDLAEALSLDQTCDPALLLNLREAVDAYFRMRCLGRDENDRLAALCRLAGDALTAGPSPTGLESSTARSALRLIASPEPERLKICGHCGWLFLDRSRNRSRNWCDMAVCGNRAKANRHYRRQREGQA